MIAGTGVGAIHLYTVQPPHVYEELRAYNLANLDHPLSLVHGVWVPNDVLADTHDTFEATVLDQTRTDIDDAVRALHGDAVLPERRGYASGTCTADVSPWVVSWAFGIETDPTIVHNSDTTNAGRTYRSRYISATEEASPTEAWLAETLGRITGLEVEYARSMPLTFSDWPTTDPLRHPTEPLGTEDMAGIDANHLEASAAWPGGLYAGYLVALRDHHAQAGIPTMILEFGIPSSLGSAHHGSLGRDQGGHDEATAMRMNGEMLRTQQDLGLARGFVFAWQDEWFKRTWNTLDTEIPASRRQLWQNPLTNESNFGLLAMDAGTEGPPVFIDGSDQDRRADNSQAILESDGAVREVRATHDHSYLYLRLVLDEPRSWELKPIAVGFDTVPGGNGGLPDAPGVGADSDTVIVVSPGSETNMFVRASNDYNDLVLGRRLGFYPVSDSDLLDGSGAWRPQRLNVNRPLHIPVLEIDRPAEWFELNPLQTGSSQPGTPLFDSRTVWAADEAIVELRVPWAMIGLSDPSSRLALVVSADGGPSTAEMERLGISLATGTEGFETKGYTWAGWDAVAEVDEARRG
jgi:hypothetical protein